MPNDNPNPEDNKPGTSLIVVTAEENNPDNALMNLEEELDTKGLSEDEVNKKAQSDAKNRVNETNEMKAFWEQKEKDAERRHKEMLDAQAAAREADKEEALAEKEKKDKEQREQMREKLNQVLAYQHYVKMDEGGQSPFSNPAYMESLSQAVGSAFLRNGRFEIMASDQSGVITANKNHVSYTGHGMTMVSAELFAAQLLEKNPNSIKLSGPTSNKVQIVANLLKMDQDMRARTTMENNPKLADRIRAELRERQPEAFEDVDPSYPESFGYNELKFYAQEGLITKEEYQQAMVDIVQGYQEKVGSTWIADKLNPYNLPNPLKLLEGEINPLKWGRETSIDIKGGKNLKTILKLIDFDVDPEKARENRQNLDNQEPEQNAEAPSDTKPEQEAKEPGTGLAEVAEGTELANTADGTELSDPENPVSPVDSNKVKPVTEVIQKDWSCAEEQELNEMLVDVTDNDNGWYNDLENASDEELKSMGIDGDSFSDLGRDGGTIRGKFRENIARAKMQLAKVKRNILEDRVLSDTQKKDLLTDYKQACKDAVDAIKQNPLENNAQKLRSFNSGAETASKLFSQVNAVRKKLVNPTLTTDPDKPNAQQAQKADRKRPSAGTGGASMAG